MKRFATVALAASLALPTGSAFGAYLQSDTSAASGDSYWAFEAENETQSSADASNSWVEIVNTNASGGAAIQSVSDDGDVDYEPNAYYAWDLLVTDATEANGDAFNLYLRTATDGGDSMWHATTLTGSPGNFSGIGVQSDPVEKADYTFFDAGDDYDLSGLENGDTLTYYVNVREGGYVIDRVVIHQTSGLTDDQLNALPNSVVPEPASLALLGLGSLAALRRRR